MGFEEGVERLYEAPLDDAYFDYRCSQWFRMSSTSYYVCDVLVHALLILAVEIKQTQSDAIERKLIRLRRPNAFSNIFRSLCP